MRFSELKSTNGNLINLIAVFIIPLLIFIIGNIATIIPYIGVFFNAIMPFIAFFVYFIIGAFSGDIAAKLSDSRRFIVVCYMFIIVTVIFGTTYVVGYYTYPVKVSRAYKTSKHILLTYSQASDTVKNILREYEGSDGVLAFAIYSERIQLSAHSYGDYVGDQFEDIDDVGGIITAVLNIIIHTIPMLLKWIICDKLGWITDAGLVGLVFWYFFSIFLSYAGWYKPKK